MRQVASKWAIWAQMSSASTQQKQQGPPNDWSGCCDRTLQWCHAACYDLISMRFASDDGVSSWCVRSLPSGLFGHKILAAACSHQAPISMGWVWNSLGIAVCQSGGVYTIRDPFPSNGILHVWLHIFGINYYLVLKHKGYNSSIVLSQNVLNLTNLYKIY